MDVEPAKGRQLGLRPTQSTHESITAQAAAQELCLLDTHPELSVVQVGDGGLCGRSISHGHKGKATRAAALTVSGDEGILCVEEEEEEGRLTQHNNAAWVVSCRAQRQDTIR